VRALDLFAYHGSFALHLARRAREVIAVDSSADALARGAENAALNVSRTSCGREANAFDLLRDFERRGEQFDTSCSIRRPSQDQDQRARASRV